MCDKLGPAALDTDGAEGSILITSTLNPIKGGGLLWASLDAEAVADREEEFIYRGQSDFRLPGLLTHEGRQQLDGGDWAAVERALSDVLAAVTQLALV